MAGFARQRLLREPAHFVVLLRCGELIAERAAHFTVQMIALKAGDFLPIPQHAMHMAAAVGKPIGALAIGVKSIESDLIDCEYIAHYP
uniref:hypothetical protein n=1 Tax=Chitinibacter fontanus TaxID=1737446 RepID=UPI001D1531CC